MYNISIQDRAVSYDPAACAFQVTVGGETWQWCRVPHIRLSDDTRLPFADAECTHNSVDNGVEEGVRAEYAFDCGAESTITAVTHMMVAKESGRVSFRIRVEGD